MTYVDNSPVRGRSSPWSELTRRCSQKRLLIQKRYWCFWIVGALFPFTLLRMVYLCNMSSVEEQESSEISVVMMESEDRLPHKHPSIFSIGSTDTELDVKSSISLNVEVGSTLHERVSIENSQVPNKFGKKNHKDWKRKASESNEKHFSRQSLGQQLEHSEGYIGLPEDNEKIKSVTLVSVEEQQERPTGEHSTPAGSMTTAEEKQRKVSKFKAKQVTGHSSGTQDKAYVGLSAQDNTMRSDSMAVVIAETQENKQEKKQGVWQDENHDKIPNGGNSTFVGNLANEGQNIEAEEHLTATEEVPPSTEEMLNRSESEKKGPITNSKAGESKRVGGERQAQERDVDNERAMETSETEQNWPSEEQNWKDDRQEPQQDDVAASKEAEQQKEEEERKNVDAVEEKREEEELKDAEGIEREMIEEQQIHAIEQEEKHENGGSVIVEVTDRAQGEEPEEAKPAEECDLFKGDWVWDPEGPLYTNSTCFYMQLAQNCMSNGRPDSDYLHWKWKPRGCNLPRFDARAFLEAFRGKTIGFVGDSLARNQMQSLLCMLSQIDIPKLVYQSHDDATVRWLYEQHQVTLAVLWSPYLLKESNEGIMGFEKGQSVLYLDELDSAWTSEIQDLDIIVLSIGQWYFKGSIYVKQRKVVGCHYCPGFRLTQMAYQEAYRGAVRQVLEKVASEFKGIVIMSTFAISHFEDGSWDNGGQCRREKPLDKEEAAKFPGLHNDMHDIVMSEFNRIAYDKSKLNENVKLEFLDVTKVSLTRADGHPGPYRRANPYEGKDPNEWVPNDCLHWCLPGPVDTWNQLLVKLVHRHI